MLIHNTALPEEMYSCIYCCFKTKDNSTLNQHIMSHLTSSCASDAISGESTSQYSSSFYNDSNSSSFANCDDMFTMLQKDIERYSNDERKNDSMNNNLYYMDGYNGLSFEVGFSRSELLIE